MDEKIGVSVVCTVYNHAKYLRECLDGFVSQKTNFLFEVIVHDDASTDSSAEIIREYAEKYPEIIKPIIQVENQYSQGADIIKEFIVPVVRGEYVALCEGDDFWCDSSKLQKQYNALQDHPECFMCTNKVERVCEDGRSQNFYYPAIKVKEGVLSSRNFLETCRGHVFQTSSYFFCAEPWKTFRLNPPEFKQLSDVGDEPYLLFFGHTACRVLVPQQGFPGSSNDKEFTCHAGNLGLF